MYQRKITSSIRIRARTSIPLANAYASTLLWAEQQACGSCSGWGNRSIRTKVVTKHHHHRYHYGGRRCQKVRDGDGVLPSANGLNKFFSATCRSENKDSNPAALCLDDGNFQHLSQAQIDSKNGTALQDINNAHAAGMPLFTRIIDGPSLRLGANRMAHLADASVVGIAGSTTVFATVTSEKQQQQQKLESKALVDALERHADAALASSFMPFTVDYRQRHHAVGRIPTAVASRTDNKRPTTTETLGSRCIDRAIRPVLKQTHDAQIHLSCSVQSLSAERSSNYSPPVALSINAAAAALSDRIMEPIAAVSLCLQADGTVVIGGVANERGKNDAGKISLDSRETVCELLYVCTMTHVVMMECFGSPVPEATLVKLIELAHASARPLLGTHRKMAQALDVMRDDGRGSGDNDALRKFLGLSLLEAGNTIATEVVANDGQESLVKQASRICDELIFGLCKRELGDAPLRLFGVDSGKSDSFLRPPPTGNSISNLNGGGVLIHSKHDATLLDKATRGRREQIIKVEIERLVRLFFVNSDNDELRKVPSTHSNLVTKITNAVHSKILKEAFTRSAIDYGTRADGRKDATTIRPLAVSAPALPSTVHGSSTFVRGETQVLCTCTLGPPQDGRPLRGDPFERRNWDRSGRGDRNRHKKHNTDDDNDDESENQLPVGSLRYLKTQEYLLSDLNSRRIRADREQTGDSGTLQELARIMLQYDFPQYSKGSVATSGNAGTARREIGHGALALAAIQPVLPRASEFPYAVRLTSEVTSSNGSSSMATVCGSTLALLDAGVPITETVAGVSVGAAVESDERYRLLLDITGTEDHYGSMDFKISGTRTGITSLHLDVKQPLPHAAVFGALRLAKNGRVAILDEMSSQLQCDRGLMPRSSLKASAPRVAIVRFDPMRKKDLLGPGGVVIRQLEERYNVSLDLTQEGCCLLFGDDPAMVRKAKAAVMELVCDVVVGGVYEGTIIELRDYGVVVELLRNKEGICHVSLMADREEIRSHPRGAMGVIRSLVRIGQKIEVRCTAVDTVQGTIRLEPTSKITQATGSASASISSK